MTKRRVEQEVGYFIYDDETEEPFCYEQDYGVNTYGDAGYFYRNEDADCIGFPNICYISEVPNGSICSNDPGFSEYTYTYDKVVDICQGDYALAELVLELAIGQSIEAIYDEVKDVREDDD